jgi:rare lipoprotein A
VRVTPPPAESPTPVSTSSPATLEPAAPPAPVLLAPTTEAGYKIQVAAAASVEEGRMLLERLTSAGYPAYLSRAVVSNTEVFRVRVGPFDALPAAEEIASQLKRDGFTGAWIAR